MECRIQHFVLVVKCRKCLQFDHVDTERSPNRIYCPRCGKNHAEDECRSTTTRCHAWHYFNLYNKHRHFNTRHHSFSPLCHTLRNCRRVKQLELENPPKVRSTGDDVALGRTVLRENFLDIAEETTRAHFSSVA